MSKYNERVTRAGSAAVSLLGKNIVVCRLEGYITGKVVEGSMRETRLLAKQIPASQHPILLLDIHGVTRQTSEARSRAKDLSEYGFERIAVAGGSRPIVLMGRYIARAAGMGNYTRFFRTEKAAMQWLQLGTSHAADTQRLKRYTTSAAIILLALATLVGWSTNTPLLTSVIPTFKPMNPMTAVTLLLLAVAVIVMKKGWQSTALRRRIILVIAGWSLLFGTFVLLKYLFRIDTHIDSWLFNNMVGTGTLSGRTAPSVGLCCVALGTILLLLATGMRVAWQRITASISAVIVLFLCIALLIGFSFGFHRVFDFNNFLPMPIGTAIALLLLTNSIIPMIPTKGRFKKITEGYYGNWQAIMVALLLLFVTGTSWQQSKRDIRNNVEATASAAFAKTENTITARFAAYTDAMNGYKGLFAASNEVTPADFHEYFINSGLATNYPGFNAFTYAAAVPEASKQAFIVQTRAQATAAYPKYKDFTINPQTTNALHYPLIFIEPNTPTTNYGFDLSNEATRKAALEKARDNGGSIASGIINLNAARGKGAPDEFGFFLSLPVYKNTSTSLVKGSGPDAIAARRANIQGFIIAYFANARLFNDLFSQSDAKDARFTITDNTNNKLIFSTAASEVPKDALIKETKLLEVGERQWRLDMYVSPGYGILDFYRYLPTGILAGGMLLSLLAGLVVWGQLRRRDQAMTLADRMTEDLNNERNIAIAIQRKDEAILSSIGDAVFAIDTTGRITLFNMACEVISGYTKEEVLGKPYAQILRFEFEKNAAVNDTFIRRALAGHISSMSNHTVLVHKDGHRTPVADSAAPIHDIRGNILGAIIVFRDVSQEQELDRAKTEFVSLASHQLRTPLSAINWYGELLLGGDAGKLSQEQTNYVQEIYNGNQRMIDLVNALLDVSRLDLGKLSNQPIPTDMKDLADSLKKELHTLIVQKKIKFVQQVQGTLPAVLADPKLLRMIVQNLLSNAIKYSPDNGAVHVTMRRASEQELHQVGLKLAKQYLFMSVSDSGYGIPKAQQKKIFSKLFRADNVRALDVEGTGLGLYIVKEVVKKLGGKVWFTSTEGVGSTFYVILPFKTKGQSIADNTDQAAPSSDNDKPQQRHDGMLQSK